VQTETKPWTTTSLPSYKPRRPRGSTRQGRFRCKYVFRRLKDVNNNNCNNTFIYINVESVKYNIMQGDADCIILKRLCAETVIKLNGICATETNGRGEAAIWKTIAPSPSSEWDYNNIIILLNTSIYTGVQLRSADAAAASSWRRRRRDNIYYREKYSSRVRACVCVFIYIQLQYQSFI